MRNTRLAQPAYPINRRTFLKTAAAAGAGAGFVFCPSAGAQSKGNPPDDSLLAQAAERIEQHRKADGVIAMRAADGKPVPGAVVRIEQVRHEFLFGCNFFAFDRVGDPEGEQLYRERFADLLNYATLPFYWRMYEPRRGEPQYDYSTKAEAWCRQHGIVCKGHPLVWDEPSGSPAWLPDEAQEIERLSNDRVREIVTRFKERIDFWDVVNEPTQPNRQQTRMGKWAAAKGAVPYVREHLAIARAANPQATLLVNDYSLGRPYYRILDALRENGKPLFDAAGLQSHMHGGAWPLHRVWDTCETFAKLKVPLHFTETTIVSGPRAGDGKRWGPTTPELEARQAEQVVKFYTMVFSHPATAALTWWDFSDRRAWQGAAAGLLRKDMSPKPAYEKLLGLIKGEWWTKTEGKTDGQGELRCRAFLGTQRISVEAPGRAPATREMQWRRDGANRVEVVMA